MMPLYINDQGDWKKVDDPSVNVGSDWKEVDYAYVNNNGTWELIYSCFSIHTPITMASGNQKPLGNVKQGDEVLSFEFDSLPKEDWGGVNFFSLRENISPTKSKVIHSSYTFRQNYYIINGKKITRDHPLLVYNKQEDVYSFERVYDVNPNKFDLVDYNLNRQEIEEFGYFENGLEVGAIGLKNNSVYFADGIIVHHNI